MKRFLAFLCLLSLALTACTGAKALSPFPSPKTNLSQWSAFAADVAKAGTSAAKPEAAAERSVQLLPPSEATPFSKTFSELLATELVKAGITVSENRSSALTLKFNAQIVSETEVLLTTTLMDGLNYLQRHSRTLKLDEGQRSLYQKRSSIKLQNI